MSQEILREIIRNDPNDKKWAYYLWAFIKRNENNLDRAKEFFQLALEEDPNFKEALTMYGWIYYQTNDFGKALEMFSKAAEIDPSDYSINQGLALSSWRVGDSDNAEKYYLNNVENHSENIYSYKNYAAFLNFSSQDTSATAALWKKASETLTESSDHYMSLGEYYKIIGKEDSLIICAEKALEYNPDNTTALEQLASYEYDVKKDFQASIVHLKKLIGVLSKKRYDDHMKQNVLNQLAMAEYQVNEMDSSRVHVMKAIELNPNNPYPWTTLAELSALEGKTNEFFDHLEKAASLGFRLEYFQDEEIYRDYKSHPRFKALIQSTAAVN